MPAFIEHARATYPADRFALGAVPHLPVRHGSLAGAVAWYSLIHLPPPELDAVLVELRRTMGAAGCLVAGFFDGERVMPFAHKVATAYYWPVDAFSERLRRAGFEEIERLTRPGVAAPGQRPHAAVAAIAI